MSIKENPFMKRLILIALLAWWGANGFNAQAAADTDEVVVTENADDVAAVDEEYSADHDDELAPYTARFGEAAFYYYDNNRPYPLENLNEDIAAQNYDKILADAKTVLSERPDSPDALYSLACAYFFLQDFDNMIAVATHLVELYPADTFANSLLMMPGQAHADKVLASLRDALARHRESERVDKEMYLSVLTYAHATTCLGYGYLREACDNFDTLVDNPLWGDDALRALANCYRNMDRPEKSLVALERVSSEAHDSRWITSLIIATRQTGDIDSALSSGNTWLTAHPDDHEVAIIHATNLTLNGSYPEAIAVLDSAEKSIRQGMAESVYYTYFVPNAEALLQEIALRRGIAHTLAGDTEGGRADFHSIESGSDNSMYMFAQAYLGNRDEALEAMQPYNEYDGYYETKASIYNILGDTDKALEFLALSYEKNLWSPQRTRDDINQRSLLDNPGFAAVKAKFNP